MRWRIALAALALLCAAADWSPQPWLDDLAQLRVAIDEKYANRDWLTGERGVDLDALFARTAARLRDAHNDADARAVFDRLIQRIGDGHVGLRWPITPSVAASSSAPASLDLAGFCRARGYDETLVSAGTAGTLPGYRPLPASTIPAGIVPIGDQSLGVLRIGVFDAHGFPRLCEQAVAKLRIDHTAPCDDACDDRVLTQAYILLTATLEDRLRALKVVGATALLVDISDNGGGTEWAEAALRTLTARRVVSGRLGFVRGAHWTKSWGNLAGRLRREAARAGGLDRARLSGWAKQADAARHDALIRCESPTCERIGRAGYGTGLVGAATAGEYAGKSWGSLVFSPAQYPYRDGVWDGPLIVLVDQETWSAAEEVAAVLQDNRAALIVGARTGGAGCGHTDGGTPTLLAHSGATLELPDCVRLRADGSNEVRGIVPDLTLPTRASDGRRSRQNCLPLPYPMQ